MSKLFAIALGALVALTAHASRAQEVVAPTVEPLDPAAVFRYDPIAQQNVAVAAEEIKLGNVYFRYSPLLKQHVWSLAIDGGGFAYAMAPGSVVQARQLDIRATPEQQRQALQARAPEMAQIMDIRGARAYVKLDDAGQWQILRRPTVSAVYDLETLRRWEWHGGRRVAVLHTAGDDWLLVDGKFAPASYSAPFGYAYQSGLHCCW